MSIKRELKHTLREIKLKLSSKFKKKIPVFIPTYKTDLLKGKIALITGATSGIGYSIADMFCKNGGTVIVTGRNEQKLKTAYEKIIKENPNSKIYKNILDLSKPDLFEKRLGEIVDQLENKKIDILVNNAGVAMSGGQIENPNIESYDKIMDCNLKGTYFLSSLFVRYMKSNKIKGNILNVSSSSQNRPVVDTYALSKWGIKGLTLGMAKKYIDDGIVVNAIAPGPTATRMMKNDRDDNINRQQYPMERLVTPEEVANLAVFLVSDMGRTIVGQTIYMSYGLGVITVDDIEY